MKMTALAMVAVGYRHPLLCVIRLLTNFHALLFIPPSSPGLAEGAKAVVVTLGSRGCMLVSSSSDGYRRFEAEKVDAVDTVGAGDAFLGSLGAYLARGMALEDAIQGAVR